jgi:hypothetical protein
MGVNASALDCCDGKEEDLRVISKGKFHIRRPRKKFNVPRAAYDRDRLVQEIDERAPKKLNTIERPDFLENVECLDYPDLSKQGFKPKYLERDTVPVHTQTSPQYPHLETRNHIPWTSQQRLESQEDAVKAEISDSNTTALPSKSDLRKHSPWVEQHLYSQPSPIMAQIAVLLPGVSSVLHIEKFS